MNHDQAMQLVEAALNENCIIWEKAPDESFHDIGGTRPFEDVLKGRIDRGELAGYLLKAHRVKSAGKMVFYAYLAKDGLIIPPFGQGFGKLLWDAASDELKRKSGNGL